MRKYVPTNTITRLIVVLCLSVSASAFLFQGSVSAYTGTGYFKGARTCTTNSSFSACTSSASVSQNDVISGRTISNGFNAVPVSARSSKSGFLTWIDNQRSAALVRDRQGARFIIRTMTGGDTYPELVTRINNPNVGMRVVNDDPNNYGNGRISFSGLSDAGGRDVFFTNYNASARRLLVFYNVSNPSQVYYVLEVPCANPVGGLPGLPASQPWRIVGSTTKSASTAYAGQTVSFSYRLQNPTGYDTNRSTNWRADYQNNAAGWSNLTSGDRGSVPANATRTVHNENYTIPSNAPEGAEYCRRVSWSWTSSTDTSRSYSGRDCVRVVLPPWQVIGGTTISTPRAGSTAYPGDTVTFDYRLLNPTAYSTTRSTNWRADQQVNTGSWSNITSGNYGTIPANTLRIVWTENYTIPSNAAEGTEYCRRISWDWTSTVNRTRSYSSRNCVQVVYNYALTPSLNVPVSSITQGDSITGIVGTINNAGPTQSNTSTWGVVRFVVPSGTAYSASGGSTSLGSNAGFHCQLATRYTAAPNQCAGIAQGSDQYSVGSTDLSPVNDSLSGVNLAAGDRVCYALLINRYEDGRPATDWRYSTLRCVIVGKTPFVHIWGNNLRVGSALDIINNRLSEIRGRTTRVAGTTYGSWTEYGVMAPSSVTAMASASGLVGGNPAAAQSGWSGLTFSNVSGFGSFAPANSMGTLPDIASYVGRLQASGVHVSTTGDLSSWPNAGGPSQIHRIVRPGGNGRIQINGNIIAPPSMGSYNTVADMPQLIIIADRIDIRASVTRIDAWLIASDYIDTCSDGPAQLTFTDCDERLTVNGPIIARQLLLRRTAGADNAATLNEPSEILNLPASAYLWARHYDERDGRLKTVSSTELPPRY